MAEKVTSVFGGHNSCRRRIKMSPLCRLEMTLPRGFPGGVRGDGSADERRGADAARSAAGSGSKTIDDRGGGAIVEARASSGVPAVEGVPDHGSGGPDLESTRSPQQPAQARGASKSGTGDHSRMVLGFRPDPGGREAARGSCVLHHGCETSGCIVHAAKSMTL